MTEDILAAEVKLRRTAKVVILSRPKGMDGLGDNDDEDKSMPRSVFSSCVRSRQGE